MAAVKPMIPFPRPAGAVMALTYPRCECPRTYPATALFRVIPAVKVPSSGGGDGADE